MNDLTRREALLIELVWILSYGTNEETGLSLKEVMDVIDARVRTREMKTVLEVLDAEGHSFIKEITQFLANPERKLPNGKSRG